MITNYWNPSSRNYSQQRLLDFRGQSYNIRGTVSQSLTNLAKRYLLLTHCQGNLCEKQTLAYVKAWTFRFALCTAIYPSVTLGLQKSKWKLKRTLNCMFWNKLWKNDGLRRGGGISVNHSNFTTPRNAITYSHRPHGHGKMITMSLWHSVLAMNGKKTPTK